MKLNSMQVVKSCRFVLICLFIVFILLLEWFLVVILYEYG